MSTITFVVIFIALEAFIIADMIASHGVITECCELMGGYDKWRASSARNIFFLPGGALYLKFVTIPRLKKGL